MLPTLEKKLKKFGHQYPVTSATDRNSCHGFGLRLPRAKNMRPKLSARMPRVRFQKFAVYIRVIPKGSGFARPVVNYLSFAVIESKKPLK